ncbi:Hypothetical_protein [Hexamita inflata]|uniref:Hypothetical_protein n=1 Tax=Hexamita inflata TaxID=28002 RepID=A0AA86NQ55_9EUKA|nr:Hypothetical protein HINF_LOCUS10868 [Hexamita inflata]
MKDSQLHTQEQIFLRYSMHIMRNLNHQINDQQSVIHMIMELHNKQYQLFWLLLSTLIPSVSTQILQQYFVNNIVNKYLFKKQGEMSSKMSSDAEQRFRKSVDRQKSYKSDQQKEVFASALKNALRTLTQRECDNISNSDLCAEVDSHLQVNNKAAFWNCVASSMDGKTRKQVQDYYIQSFQKLRYNRLLTVEDKLLLRQLSNQMEDQKPAAVVQQFLCQVENTDYFKHNIMMYVINFRRQQK